MFLGLAMPADAAENPALTKRLYADALSGLPIGEATAVLRLYRIGDLGDGTWCPKPGEIRQAILTRIGRRAAADRQERLIAEQVAERSEARGPQSDGERARVQAMVDRFKAGLPDDGLRAGEIGREPTINSKWRAPTKDEAEATLAAPPPHWSAPVTISSALAEKLGIDPPEKRPLSVDETDSFARETL